jgi:mttA/Hcf106 family
MFDTKILLVILVIALVVFGAKRIRTLGSDLGAYHEATSVGLGLPRSIGIGKGAVLLEDFDSGVESFLTVLDAERSLYAADDALAQK